ncbi:uncharacterized protein LOC127131662 [Lathyrus oleraceus]|uniref:uncharacterized protein LOC127131662 n=1 Tax=Pisum sativum TaxID=3888 RepID=UPI0021CE116F|nr:uncharacterized protein LOC127131662 [Pisum sativum]
MLRACVLESGGNWKELLPLIEFAYNNSYHASIGMAPYEALYGRKCRTPLCWTEVGKERILGLEIIQETTERIRMVTLRLRLKGPFKSRKLSPRCIRPYHIIERIGEVAYKLALPHSLSEMHDIFHVSQLRKFIPDSLQPILPDSIEVEVDLTSGPLPSRIAGREVKVLKNKEIPLIKVQWDESDPGDATCELESEMREAYPHLFQLSIGINRVNNEFRLT